MGKRILVLGSSFGGFNAAIRLRKLLGGEHGITVVSADPMFTFTPSLPWVAMGWREPSTIQHPVAERLRKAGISHTQDTITRLEPAACRAIGESGTYDYDYLVAATGSELDFAAVPGLGPDEGHSHALFTVEHALAVRRALEKLYARGDGSIVVGNAQGASCLGPAYEMAFMIDTVLRRKKLRGKFSISLFTNEPYAGHFGVGGFGAMRRMLEDEFADRDIECITNARLAAVTPEGVELEGGRTLVSDFSLITPPFYGSHAYMGEEGLANPRGFLLANGYLANPRYPNIYAVGVALAIPPKEATPVPVGVPKTGQMTETMALRAAHNIAADIGGGEKVRGGDFGVLCIADAGNTAFLVGASPLQPPRNRLAHKKGKIFHYMKAAFEIYYMAHVRYGLPMPENSW